LRKAHQPGAGRRRGVGGQAHRLLRKVSRTTRSGARADPRVALWRRRSSVRSGNRASHAQHRDQRLQGNHASSPWSDLNVAIPAASHQSRRPRQHPGRTSIA
jgi:hypothetical protein